MTIPIEQDGVEQALATLRTERMMERRRQEERERRKRKEKQERQARKQQIAAEIAERKVREARANAERKLREAKERAQEQARQAELNRQRAREADARRDFARLKEKYGAGSYPSSNPTDQLYPILLSLESGESSIYDHTEWFRDHGVFGPLALDEEHNFEHTHDIWSLVRASKMWRDVDCPDRAIEATAKARTVPHMPTSARSALLTTRGAAFRDLGFLDKAENCAKEAIRSQPQAHYAYNLLGAIYYDRGNHVTGDGYFSQALERGASSRSQDSAIRESIRKQEHISQRATVEYLLNKDPERFAWARYYLE